MKKTFFIIAAAFVMTAPSLAAAAVLTLEECLAVAEANHPSIAGADGQIASQRGRLTQTAAADRLSADGTVSTTRSGSDAGERDSYSAGVSAGIRVFDSNRNKYNIDSQRGSLAATEEEKRATLADVRTNVKTAYMTLLLDMETAGHRLESLRAFEAYLEQAKAFYDAGIQPWYNVTQAEVELGKAQLALLEAESGIETAKYTLFNAMGIDVPEEEYGFAPIEFEIPDVLPGEKEFISEALGSRSDYKASEYRLLAGEASLKSAARESSPSMSVSGGYDRNGQEVDETEGQWRVGLSMSIPIIDGGAAKAGVESAKGQLVSLEANREQLRQNIALEVRKALASITRARESIRISELNVVSAEENRRIALGRYETGAGDPFEVTDALLSYTEARLGSRQALYDMQLALVALDRATGK